MKHTKVKSKKVSQESKTNNVTLNHIQGYGQFTFSNGDSYIGGYCISPNKQIFKHDNGVYITSNCNKYETKWNYDNVGETAIVSFDNNMMYKGELSTSGTMNGEGVYILPDGACMKATWKNNIPLSNIIYTEPNSNFDWFGKQSKFNEDIIFVPENYFWDKHK